MAVYSTDFSEYPVGSLPSDWTNRFNTTAGQVTVENRTGSVSGKVLKTAAHTGNSVYVGASWNALDSDANRADFEIASIFTLRGASMTECAASTFGRGSGTGLSTASIIAASVNGLATSTAKRILKRVSGTNTVINSSSYTPTAGTRMGSRIRVSGTSVQARIWEYDNEAEPSTWPLTGTVSDVSAAGWIGVVEGGFVNTSTKGPIEWEWFSAATGGDTAELPGIDATGTGSLAPIQLEAPTAGVIVKGISIGLYDGLTPQASIAGITARWWDSPTDAGAPLLKTDAASTDASGVLTLDINAVTGLGVGQSGYLSLYKAGADAQSDLHFAGRIAVSDIG